jgi:hypothetical protein
MAGDDRFTLSAEQAFALSDPDGSGAPGAELGADARRRGVKGRSSTTKAQLVRHLRRLASSPALATMAAMGGSTSATQVITTAAVVEYSRTTAHAAMNSARQAPITMK